LAGQNLNAVEKNIPQIGLKVVELMALSLQQERVHIWYGLKEGKRYRRPTGSRSRNPLILFVRKSALEPNRCHAYLEPV
jgi:hypothetical protein